MKHANIYVANPRETLDKLLRLTGSISDLSRGVRSSTAVTTLGSRSNREQYTSSISGTH